MPHFTFTVHRLLSDHLLRWRKPILTSHPCLYRLHGFLGFSSPTGGLSSSCEMIISRTNSHAAFMSLYGNICDRSKKLKKYVKFTIKIPHLTSSGIEKVSQILNKNASPYFHSVSLTTVKETHFNELYTSRLSTYIRKAQDWTLHFRTSDVRRKPRNGWLVKMGFLQRSKWSDNKRCTVKVKWGIFIENLILIP